MAWRDDIHRAWRVPTMVMDATMPVEIVRQFFPQMEEPVSATAPMPHTRVRQITDRAMAASMLIPSATANEQTNTTRRNNVERVRRYHRSPRRRRVARARAGRLPARARRRAEGEALPEQRSSSAHFNDITGRERLFRCRAADRDRPHRAVAARPSSRSRARCSAPMSPRSAATRPARSAIRASPAASACATAPGGKVEGNQHPDPRVEAVRWQICEAELIQAIGRGRGVNRDGRQPAADRHPDQRRAADRGRRGDDLGRDPAEPGRDDARPRRGADQLPRHGGGLPGPVRSAEAAENALRARKTPYKLL